MKNRHNGKHGITGLIAVSHNHCLHGKSIKIKVGQQYSLCGTRSSAAVQYYRRIVTLSFHLITAFVSLAFFHEIFILKHFCIFGQFLYLSALSKLIPYCHRNIQFILYGGYYQCFKIHLGFYRSEFTVKLIKCYHSLAF
ncbi:MAG: hypothetical protein BWX78_01753 [Firmicutes bacterium ADurb.Bin099]|nr:MAG: hypothetical protein BWX78_01753 [Firmicutes bacterium ADurb.Bin099]